MSSKVGTYYRIPLGDGRNAYARLIVSGVWSFYKIDDLNLTDEELMLAVDEAAAIFHLHIYTNVFTDSGWQVLGQKPLGDNILSNLPVFFRQDMTNKALCWLITTEPGDGEHPLISPEECVNMEREAVWDFQKVEQRLRDYFDNKPNISAERLKVAL